LSLVFRAIWRYFDISFLAIFFEREEIDWQYTEDCMKILIRTDQGEAEGEKKFLT
jgi:hypothetical protein